MLLGLVAACGPFSPDGEQIHLGRSERGLVLAAFQDGVAPSPAYQGTADTYLDQSVPTTSFGSSATLEVDGNSGSGSGHGIPRHPLLRWDISSIPAGSVVTAVNITLQVSRGSAQTFDVYEVRKDWVENEATWQLASASQGWELGGATGSTDRGSTVLGGVNATTTGSYTFALNAAGIAVVQGWVDAPASNRGLTFQNLNTNDVLRFGSREAAVASDRPRLEVTYNVPADDAGTDGGVDGGGDAGTDAGTDAGADAGDNPGEGDGGMDAGGDGGADAGPADGGNGQVVFTSASEDVATCEVPYRYTPALSDPGPCALEVQPIDDVVLPSGLELEPSQHDVIWLPRPAEAGVHRILLIATCPSGRATHVLTISVECEAKQFKLGCGCRSADHDGALVWGVVLFLAVVIWRRRPSHAPRCQRAADEPGGARDEEEG